MGGRVIETQVSCRNRTDLAEALSQTCPPENSGVSSRDFNLSHWRTRGATTETPPKRIIA